MRRAKRVWVEEEDRVRKNSTLYELLIRINLIIPSQTQTITVIIRYEPILTYVFLSYRFNSTKLNKVLNSTLRSNEHLNTQSLVIWLEINWS